MPPNPERGSLFCNLQVHGHFPGPGLSPEAKEQSQTEVYSCGAKLPCRTFRDEGRARNPSLPPLGPIHGSQQPWGLSSTYLLASVSEDLVLQFHCSS